MLLNKIVLMIFSASVFQAAYAETEPVRVQAASTVGALPLAVVSGATAVVTGVNLIVRGTSNDAILTQALRSGTPLTDDLLRALRGARVSANVHGLFMDDYIGERVWKTARQNYVLSSIDDVARFEEARLGMIRNGHGMGVRNVRFNHQVRNSRVGLALAAIGALVTTATFTSTAMAGGDDGSNVAFEDVQIDF